MELYRAPASARNLGGLSVILGIVGGAFYWWTPMGIVISITGFMAGFIGWTLARRRAGDLSLVIAGMVISLATLALDGTIAVLGLELIRLHSFQ